MAYEQTVVAVSKSQEQIRKLLLENGATGVAFVSQTEPLSEGFEAQVPIDGKTYRIRVVALMKKVESQRVGRKSAYEMMDGQMRRIWRVLYYHMKSVYEAANSGVMEFRELMLPYLVVKDGRTIAQHLLPALDKAIEARPERMLSGGHE